MRSVTDSAVIVPQMHFYNTDISKMYEQIPKSVLPSEYGGDTGPIQDIVDYWEKRMLDNRDYLMDEMNYITDERKRRRPFKHAETLFGTDGSFRKLDVD